MVVFEMLMARGSRVSARNDGGDTPLHLACAHGNKEIVSKVNIFLFFIFISKKRIFKDIYKNIELLKL